MKAKPRILLYGNSIIMGTIGASLRRCLQFELLTLGTKLQGEQEIDALKPDMVLFDLEAIHAENVFSLLKTHPNLVLIGISPDINLVKVWSGRQLRELSTQDLLEVINGELNDLPAEHESSGIAVEELSVGHEETRTLLGVFRSRSVPEQLRSANEDPEMANNAVTAEERGHITKSDALKVARILRDLIKEEGGNKPNADDALDDS